MSAAGGKRAGAAPVLGSTPSDDLFRDGKDPAALRTIGEVARALGLRQHVLRYWEDQFPNLRPLTRAGGRRYYRAEDVALLREIDRLLHREGYTIRGARAALAKPAVPVRRAPTPRDTSAPLFDPPAPASDAPENQMIAALGTLRHHLEGIRTRLAAAIEA